MFFTQNIQLRKYVLNIYSILKFLEREELRVLVSFYAIFSTLISNRDIVVYRGGSRIFKTLVKICFKLHTRSVMKRRPMGVEAIRLGVRGFVSPPMGYGAKPHHLAISPLNMRVFKDFKMVFNYIILANFNKTDSVHVVFLIRNSLDVSYFFYCFKQ